MTAMTVYARDGEATRRILVPIDRPLEEVKRRADRVAERVRRTNPDRAVLCLDVGTHLAIYWRPA